MTDAREEPGIEFDVDGAGELTLAPERDLVSFAFLHPGEWSAAFGMSLLELWLYDACHEQRMVSHEHGLISKECGSGGIVAGRNQATRIMLEGAAAWLFFVDADMGFDVDTIERLLESADPTDRPVMGALCFAQKSDGRGPQHAIRYRACPTVYDAREGADGEVGFLSRMDYERDAVVKADATGAACILIHRSVLEAIAARVGPVWFDPIELKGTTFSEDLSFCLRCAAVGAPIHVDTSVRTTHDKGGVFLDEETFDRQEVARRADHR